MMYRAYDLSLLYLREMIKEEGLKLDSSLKDVLTTIASEKSIPLDELLKFSQIIVGEQVIASTGLKVELPVMEENRFGEIAFLIVQYKIQKGGIHLDANLRRKVGHRAAKMGITVDEAMDFTRIVVNKAFFE